MSEFAHHVSWLRPIEEKLDSPTPPSDEDKEGFRYTLFQVLAQNPESQMAKNLLAAIDRPREAAARDVQSVMREPPHVTDLATGEKIYNIPMTRVPNEQGQFVFDQLRNGFEMTSRQPGTTANLRPAVASCSRNGPFPGFHHVFSDEQVQRLGHADAQLAEYAYREFVRLGLAQDVEEIIGKGTNILDAHVVPLIGKIRSKQARESIADTVRMWKENAANPIRNMYYRTNRWATPGTHPQRDFAIPLYAQNPSFFSVGLMDNEEMLQTAAAAYDPAMRVLLMRKMSGGESDFLSALDIVHEMTHLRQQNRHLKVNGGTTPESLRKCNEEYAQVHTATGAFTVIGSLSEEAEAWSNMIELFVAKIGYGTKNTADILALLDIDQSDPRQMASMRHIIEFTQSYNGGGGRKGHTYPPLFLKEIEALYARLGMNLSK